MSNIQAEDDFIYGNPSTTSARQASWENQLIDDYDQEYAPGQRVCIDDASMMDWDRVAEQRRQLRDWQIEQINNGINRDMLTECNPNILSGERVFKGTRVSVTRVVDQFKNGVAKSIIKQDFPQLNSSQILYAENKAKQQKALDEMTQWAEINGLYDDYEKDAYLEYELNRESEEMKYDIESLSRDFMDALDRGDNVHHPSHYRSGNIECIEAIEEALTEEEMRGYFKGNCLKYLWRERYKNGTEDLQKAYFYLGRLIDNLED